MKVGYSYHWSMNIPKGSFLTVKYFPLNLVSLSINSEEYNSMYSTAVFITPYSFLMDCYTLTVCSPALKTGSHNNTGS